MKKIGLYFEGKSRRVDRLLSLLSNYEIFEVQDHSSAKELLEKSFDDFAAFIVDNPAKMPQIDELLAYIHKKNNYMFSLPVIVSTDSENISYDDKFLGSPVVAIISSSDTEAVIKNRIENAIKLANSTSFDAFSEMLTVLPSLVYLKDNQGRYAFCSQQWHHLTDRNESIRGKTDFDVRKDKENARLARQSDLEVINSGKGKSYVIKEVDEEGTDYLQIIKEPLKNKSGEVYGIIAIINNVTTQELLRQELREKSITDQLTGLYNRAYFEELTHWQGKDLKSPLTIISADCDGLKQINDKFGHAAGDQYICYAKDALRKALPKKSYLFRMGGDEFLAVVPETDKEEAKVLLEKINKTTKQFKNKDFALKLSVGSYTIGKHKGSIENAVIMSDQQMYKVKKEHKKKEK